MTIRKEPKKPWFNQHSYELRKYCQNLFHLSKRDSKYLAEYSIARKAYQSHLRYAKKSYEESKNQNLIDKSLRNGIHELYKQGRKKTENNSISLNDLFNTRKIFTKTLTTKRLNCYQVVKIKDTFYYNPLLSTRLNLVFQKWRAKPCLQPVPFHHISSNSFHHPLHLSFKLFSIIASKIHLFLNHG